MITEEMIKQRSEEISKIFIEVDGEGYTGKLERRLFEIIADVQLRLEALEEKEEKSFEDDTKEFLFACKEARNKFCFDILKQEWKAELRTSAADILVMYDQLITRLENAARGK